MAKQFIILFFCVFASLVISHRIHFNETIYEQLELKGEKYYNEQKDERYVLVAGDINRVHPNFPCVYGTIPLGSETSQGIDDGHKFACGIQFIKGEPILYSFGSCKDQSFELSFLEYRPDAKVYIFEIDPNNLPNERDPRITYFNVGLGGFPADWYYPLQAVRL
jgi:hypothetical protein